MSPLRKKLLKLAHSIPETRIHLIPLLRILKASKGTNFQDFLDLVYGGMEAMVPNPNPKTREQFREVQVSTALGDDRFYNKALAEYQAWLKTAPKPPTPPKKKSSFPKGVISKDWGYKLWETNSAKNRTDSIIEDLNTALDTDKINRDTLVRLTGLPFAGLTEHPGIRFNEEGEFTLFDQDYILGLDRAFSVNKDGKAYIRNHAIKLDEDKAPKGTGTRMFANQVAEASELGFSHIECQAYQRAPKWNGGKVWPKLGYDGIVPIFIPRHLESQMIEDQAKKPYRFSDLMVVEGGPEWWDNNAASFEGTFDLTPGSYSMRTLQNYVEQKAKLAGVSVEEWLTENPEKTIKKQSLLEIIAKNYWKK